MAEDEVQSGGGLKKLADYLAQTRRQAEASIDVLNKRIDELTSELEVSHAAAEHLQSERDYFRNHAEQLKLENSKKWRLQERDDWKSLVDSVQQDRSRLQDECHRLETALEEKEREIEALRQQQQQRQRAPLSPVSSTSRFFFGSPVSSSPSDGEAAPGATASESPRAMNKQLKLELAKAHASLQVARASAESEISSLKLELERARKSKHPSGTVWARGGSSQGRFSSGGSPEEAGWYDPLGIFHFFFTGSKRDRTAVLRV